MPQKNKLLLLDFDEIQLIAIKDWLKSLGDIDAISSDSILERQSLIDNKNYFDLIIQSLNEKSVEINDDEISSPLLIIESKKQTAKLKHNEIIKSPFRFEQLELKIRNILRAIELKQLESLEIHGHKYVNSRRALVKDINSEIKLTDKEIEILAYLHKNRGRPISRDEMLREVWRYQTGVTTHTLETHIYRLRQKIASYIGNLEALITDEGGYRLID